LNYKQLRFVVAVARERHFGRAASACFVSQPTLSLGIKRLEEELGVILFDRTHRQVVPTAVGQRVAEQAERVLREADHLRDMVGQIPHPLDARLRVGVTDTVAPYAVPPALPFIQEFAPTLQVSIEEGRSSELANGIASGALDMAIVSAPFDIPQAETRPLYEEPLLAVVPSDHPFTEEGVTTDSIGTQPVFLLEKGRRFRDQVLSYCPGCAHAEPNGRGGYRYRRTFETFRYLVASGLGVTVLPSRAVCADMYTRHRLVALPFADASPTRTILVAVSRACPHVEAVEVFAQAVMASLGSASGCLPAMRVAPPAAAE
jgi:LysR family hydrogen peroxide-inducible transcriptional activator